MGARWVESLALRVCKFIEAMVNGVRGGMVGGRACNKTADYWRYVIIQYVHA